MGWFTPDDPEKISYWKDQLNKLRSRFNDLGIQNANTLQELRQEQKLTQYLKETTTQLLNIVCVDRVPRQANIYESSRYLLDQTSQLRQYSRQLEQTIRGLRQKAEETTNQHRSEIANLHQQHENDRDALVRQYERHLEELRQVAVAVQQQHDSAIKELTDQHNYEMEISRQDFVETINRANRKLKSTVEKMDDDHQRATQQYRKDLEAYSEALVKRDKFSDLLRDDDIKAKFIDLVKNVDNIADLNWRDDRTVWPHQLIFEVSDNSRILRKNLLRDTIWVILYEHIFASPFRIFGSEGESLEQFWAEAAGQDTQFDNGVYSWPLPSVEAERWRYVNIEECRKALTQSLSTEWDPRLRLKTEFSYSYRKLNADLMSVLSEMIQWDEDIARTVRKMTKKASNMWLEFGLQRCRLVMVLKGSNLKSPADKQEILGEGPLRLDITPELMRYGNSKGYELGTPVTIKGCESQVFEVKWGH